MISGGKSDFRFFIAKHGFFSLLPLLEVTGLPYESGKSSSYNSEKKLFRRIIDQAIHDLGSSDLEIRNEAEEWFDIRDPDFQFICELAELDPRAVYKAVVSHLDRLAKSKKSMRHVLKDYKVSTAEELTKVILEWTT